MSKKMSRQEQLEKSADILCKNAYRLCKETFGGRNAAVDAKTLKEVSAAVKETVNVSESLRKHDEAPAAGFIVTVSAEAEEMAG